jgi:TusA-related sulfurtransferase
MPTIVDCLGLECPMPIIKIRLALNILKKDDILHIYADDLVFQSEFHRFCVLANLELLTTKIQFDSETDEPYRFYEVKVIA